MSVERDIRFDLVARLCPNTTGAELKSVATEVKSYSLKNQAKLFTFNHSRRGCSLFVRAGKWPLSETSWMLLRRWFDRGRSFLARKSIYESPIDFTLIKYRSIVPCTKYIIDRVKLNDTTTAVSVFSGYYTVLLWKVVRNSERISTKFHNFSVTGSEGARALRGYPKANQQTLFAPLTSYAQLWRSLLVASRGKK
jgi:hypothetical protein